MARRYGFYLQVVKIPLEDKIHIFVPPCNFLFIIIIDSMQKAVNDVIDIFTSENMKNTPVVIF